MTKHHMYQKVDNLWLYQDLKLASLAIMYMHIWTKYNITYENQIKITEAAINMIGMYHMANCSELSAAVKL